MKVLVCYKGRRFWWKDTIVVRDENDFDCVFAVLYYIGENPFVVPLEKIDVINHV